MEDNIKRWLDDKEKFLKELQTGRKWELVVAKKLQDAGYNVTVPECGDYNMPNDPAYKNSHDLLVEGKIVEVKSRNLAFTTPDTFPYSTLFVKSKCTYDKMVDKPVMVVCISQQTGEAIGLDVKKTYQHWSSVKFFDRVRKIHTTAYQCEKEYWEELNGLCDRLFRPSCPCKP